MTHKKIWTLYKPDATREDALYIIGLGCAVEVILPDPTDFISPNGTRWHVQNEYPYLEITTTCEKQESMLYLKYGDELRLKTIIHRKLESSYADIDLVSHSRPAAP
jgi:hypothetical protein